MPRHLAIGDIHGCVKALRTLADCIGFRPDDTIVTLGDYVDRGPDSRGVIDWLIHIEKTHTLVPLRGNHEIMMIDARTEEVRLGTWLMCGGDATLQSYSPFEDEPGKLADVPDNHWQFLDQRLVAFFETDTHFFVHANAYPDMPLDEQPDHMLYWEPFDDPPRHDSGKIMVCGHTSQRSGMPKHNDNAVCIDTWAYGNGWLTCLHVESGILWQANEKGQTREIHLEELETGNSA